MVKALTGKTYRECRRSLGLFILEKRRMRGDLISAYNFLDEGKGEGGAALLCLVRKGMRKWNEAVSGLNIRKSFFIQRVGHWNRLSREEVMVSCPEEHQDNALSHMFYL